MEKERKSSCLEFAINVLSFITNVIEFYCFTFRFQGQLKILMTSQKWKLF